MARPPEATGPLKCGKRLNPSLTVWFLISIFSAEYTGSGELRRFCILHIEVKILCGEKHMAVRVGLSGRR